MITDSIDLRVRYAETDQMRYVYYGHYAQYFEIGRTELIRRLGFTYREMEDDWGIMLPVRKLEVRYQKPARYDDLLRVVSGITEMPKASIRIEHSIYLMEEGQPKDLLVTGMVELVFVNRSTMRPVRAPETFLHALQSHG
jgi:acyl-CoA thioester hydrolase